jgi:hypothetical protein
LPERQDFKKTKLQKKRVTGCPSGSGSSGYLHPADLGGWPFLPDWLLTAPPPATIARLGPETEFRNLWAGNRSLKEIITRLSWGNKKVSRKNFQIFPNFGTGAGEEGKRCSREGNDCQY